MKIVTAGIICHKDKFLIALRIRTKKPALVWEFPGGKVEEGETLQECLKREIKEELDLEITVKNFLMTTDFNYEFGSIRMEVFFASAETDKIGKMDSHEDYRWIKTEELDKFEFAPADLPVVEKLKELNFRP